MQARLQEIYRTLGQWSSLIDTLYRRVWNGKVLLAGLAEGLGGLGLGLLGYQALKRRAQTLGVALLGLSVVIHLYAYLTRPARPVAEARERQAV